MKHIALLRGINVSGHRLIPMSRLRTLLSELKLQQVSTYLQSGNVIFESSSSSEKALAARIRASIQDEFGFDVPVVILSPNALSRATGKNPFSDLKGLDPTKLHLTFLAKAASRSSIEKLSSVISGKDRFQCSKNLVYLYCPDGYAKTKFSNTLLERVFDCEATTRNWKTVNELLRLASPTSPQNEK